MGKIKNFFRKIGEGIKKGATKVWNWSKNVVQKVAKIARPVADVASKVGGAMSALPGKAGAIGTGLAAGGETIKQITDLLPNSTAKDKINNAIDKGLDTGQQFINRGALFATNLNNKFQPWINATSNIANKVADGADKLYNIMPAQLPVLKQAAPVKLLGTSNRISAPKGFFKRAPVMVGMPNPLAVSKEEWNRRAANLAATNAKLRAEWEAKH